MDTQYSLLHSGIGTLEGVFKASQTSLAKSAKRGTMDGVFEASLASLQHAPLPGTLDASIVKPVSLHSDGTHLNLAV